MTIQRHFSILSATVFFIAALVMIAGCQKKEAQKPLPPETVITSQVQKKSIPLFDDFNGTLQSVRVVNIVPRVTGYINKCFFIEGTYVKEGDPLYLIDPRPFQAKLDAAEAQQKLDEAQLSFEQTEVARYDYLVKNNATSAEKYQEVVSKRDQLIAAVAKDKADAEDARLNLSFTNITAPFSGRIQKKNIDEGNLVSAQKDILTTLIQIDPMYVNFSMSRAKGFKVQELASKGLVFPADKMDILLKLPDGSAYEEKGKVDYISFQIDNTTDCIDLRGVIKNHPNNQRGYSLIPGQYAPVRLIFGENPNALVIPDTAIVQSQIGAVVYVVDQNNKVNTRRITIGLSLNGSHEIRGGLKEGETIIVEGVQKVKDGMLVNPQAQQTPQATTPAPQQQTQTQAPVKK